MAHLGQAPHKGGTFYRLQELVGVHKRVGKSVRGANVTDAFYGCKKVEETFRLDYQPLFGKMSPHSSPKDRTRETAEIEPRKLSGFVIYLHLKHSAF